MACRHVEIKTPHGTVGMIICGPRGRRGKKFNCQTCFKRERTKLCDFRIAPESSELCNKGLCDKCAVSAVPGKDHCPNHFIIMERETRCPKHGADRAHGCDDCHKLDPFNFGKISPEQIELWKKEYGEDSEFYQTKILGKFPTDQNTSEK